MLDSDLAELYEVPTKRLNEQVERNIERFPADFSFKLANDEFTEFQRQLGLTNIGRGGRRSLPRAFTEHGIAMLSSVLRSDVAVRVNIEIIRAFVRLRRLLATPGELLTLLETLTKTVQLHDHQIKAITDVLKQMMEPPKVETPKRRIGFTQDDTTNEDKT